MKKVNTTMDIDDNDEYDDNDNDEYDNDDNNEEINDNDDDNNEMTTNNTSTSKSTKALPTKDEQMHLQQIEILMKSNLIKLQVDEMINEIICDNDFKKNSLNKWVDQLCHHLKNATSYVDKSMVSKPLTKKWLQKNFNDIILHGYYQDTISIDFKDPKAVDVVGSSKLNTATKPYMNIDVIINMPNECFDDKDILNHAYFDKRKLYVAGIASALKHKSAADLIKSTNFAFFQGDERKPIIIVKPQLKNMQNITIRIYFSISPSVFKVSQLRADKNNVRPKEWIQQIEKSKKAKKMEIMDHNSLTGTENYNQAILEDMTFLPHYRILSKTIESCQAARDSILLLIVWLTQRSLRFEVDTFNSHTAALFIAYLFHTKRITSSSTALGVFLAALKFLAETNFDDLVLDFSCQELKKKENRSFAASLLFPIQGENGKHVSYNILWRVSTSAISQISEEALFTLSKFKNGDSDAFQSSFLKSKTFFSRYDMIFSIPIEDNIFNVEDDSTLPWQYGAKKARELLIEGLGDRVTHIHTTLRKINSDDFDSHSLHLNVDSGMKLYVGLVFDTTKSYRRVDRGPSPDDTEAVEKFRKFWGDLCSLRRFNDGSIVESVVWGGDQRGRGSIVYAETLLKEICKYILHRHLFVPDVGDKIQWSPIDMSKILSIKNNSKIDDPRLQEDADSLTSSAVEALDKLRGILTSSVKGFPLIVDNVMGVSPALRYTSFLPAIPHPLIDGCNVGLKKFQGKQISLAVSPLLIVGILMASGKWPHESQAIEKIKTAMYLRLSKLLHEQFRIKSVVHRETIDIQYLGYLFRLKFIRDEDSSFVPSQLSFSHPSMELGLHHYHIRGMQSKFSPFGDTVRLLECWVAGNMLSGHLSHETLELLTASVYLRPTGDPPSSPFVGFLQVLQRIVDYDWKSEAMIVDFTNNISSSSRTQISSDFMQRRENSPGEAAMCIISCIDNSTHLFTKTTPEAVVLPMIITLARMTTVKAMKLWSLSAADAALVCEEDLLTSNYVMDLSNVVLQFNKSVSFSKGDLQKIVANYVKGAPFARLDVYANSSHQDTSIKSIHVSENLSPNPIQEDIVQKLRETYGNMALFFWNSMKGREVCMIWRPNVFMPKLALQALNMKYKLASQDKDKNPMIITNVASIIAEIVASSEGLINNVDFN